MVTILDFVTIPYISPLKSYKAEILSYRMLAAIKSIILDRYIAAEIFTAEVFIDS